MNVPKLRFKEFRDDWLTSELDEIATTSSGGTPNRAKPEYWGGSIPWVTTSLIDFNVIINSDEFITEEGLKNSSAKLFPKDTLLMAMYGQGKTRGKVAILGLETSTNQACAAIAFHQNTINIQFAFQNLAGRYDEIRDLSNAGGQENLSAGLIKQIQITFPRLSEQTKIANFLTAIDEKISQLTQKNDLLVQYKKGVMQQIFSQKLRFKDEDGREFPEWEEKKLKDVFTIKYGKDYKHLEEGNIPLLGTGGVMKYVNQYLYDKPSVLIGRKGTIDKPQYIQTPFWTVDTLFYTEIDECYSPYFVYLLVSQVDWYKYNEATGVPSLNTTVINNVDVRLPSDIEEQSKIANFLTAIDNKITQTKTQLDAVKHYKKGLLQQLFV